MLNEWLLGLAHWVDGFPAGTALHASLYMYNWVESTHVLALTLFLGMLFLIDLRMLGLAFPNVSAAVIAQRLDRPMRIGFAIMLATGLLLYFAIPVRTTQSIWFRVKVVLLIAAAINAFLFRARMEALAAPEAAQAKLPKRFRVGAGLSLFLWAGVVVCGRTIAYDWFDCHKQLPALVYWAAGCVDELAAAAAE